MKNLKMAAGIVTVALAAPASAADLWKCSGIVDDAERLICYDALAKASSPAVASRKKREEASIRNDIIDQCQSQMGSYGASMVKACVDQDVEAYEELQTLVDAYGAIIDRCSRQMGNFGWSMVLACAEQDIEAEQALKRMRN